MEPPRYVDLCLEQSVVENADTQRVLKDYGFQFISTSPTIAVRGCVRILEPSKEILLRMQNAIGYPIWKVSDGCRYVIKNRVKVRKRGHR